MESEASLGSVLCSIFLGGELVAHSRALSHLAWEDAFQAGKRRGFGLPELQFDFRFVCLT